MRLQEVDIMIKRKETSERKAPKVAHKNPALKSPVLLILEDFDEIRAFLSRHFMAHDFDVFSASTVRDALAIAWEESPQVVIVDYDLTSENALRAIERIRIAAPESYIVLIGGANTESLFAGASEIGASKVISKVYALNEMDEILGNALKQQRSEKQATS